MKKISLFIFILMVTQSTIAQKDTLYLFIEKPFFRYQTTKSIHTGFIVKSEDKRFVCDYYKFGVINYQGWNEKGEDIYLSLKELRKEVNIDTLKYQTIKSLSKNKKWWEIHNQLSLKNKIFLLEKKETNFNSSTGKFNYSYFISPMIYEGTRKNIVPTDLSIKKGKNH